MVHIDRVEASYHSASWGKEAGTANEAMQVMMAGSQLSSADSGTLLRIAMALERLADLIDPQVRKKQRLLAEQKKKKQLQKKRAEHQFKCHMEWLKPFTDRCKKDIRDYCGKIGWDVYRLLDALRHAELDAERYWWYFDHYKLLVSTPASKWLESGVKLYGIGPVTLEKWRQLHEAWRASVSVDNDA